jgi:hypothetical protein
MFETILMIIVGIILGLLMGNPDMLSSLITG